MKLYNSESRKIEEFKPHDENQVTMYTCGPTVYHFAHIGNLRSYIMEDVLEKSLVFLGFNVKRVMNITDVGHLSGDSDDGEDKMLKGAMRENKTVMEIAQMYTDAFKRDAEKLNIKWPEIVVPATREIDSYILMIEKLLENGYAYKSGANIYFDTSKLKEYYRFGNMNRDELVVGARDSVSEDKEKKNPTDFVLWFTKSKFENHALSWDSPWGKGYPGWHIECSGISLKYLGEYLDIHCGGVDNKFPHHTNEIAQTEGVVGHKWCSYWMHVEHLNTKDGKMSKSKGEFLTVSLLEEKGYNPICYRLFCLGSHYRNQLVFSFDALDQAASAYAKLKKKIAALKNNGESVDELVYAAYTDQFKKAISNDLNTSLALTAVYDVLKAQTNDETKLALLESFDRVLGLDLLKKEEKQASNVDNKLDSYIAQKIEERKQAKKDRNFALADAIRGELKSQGIELVDTREGTTYKIIK